MSSARKGTTGAILDLLDVQTRLEICAQLGKQIGPEEAAPLAKKIESARDLLQRSILAAAKALEDGAQT